MGWPHSVAVSRYLVRADKSSHMTLYTGAAFSHEVFSLVAERRATPGFQYSDEWSLDWHSQWYSKNSHHSKKFSLSRNAFSILFRAFSKVEPSIPVSIFVR